MYPIAPDSSRPPLFVRRRRELDELLLGARTMPCPHCHRTGMVVGHGLLFGYAEHGSELVVRGRRFLCSRRFRRSGCGRTFCVRLATVVAGFSVRTHALSRTLLAVVEGLCLKAAWERISSGLSLRSGYRLWRRLLDSQSHVRTRLCSRGPPPACSDSRPLAALIAHLQHAFGKECPCLCAEFQLELQSHLFG